MGFKIRISGHRKRFFFFFLGNKKSSFITIKRVPKRVCFDFWTKLSFQIPPNLKRKSDETHSLISHLKERRSSEKIFFGRITYWIQNSSLNNNNNEYMIEEIISVSGRKEKSFQFNYYHLFYWLSLKKTKQLCVSEFCGHLIWGF